MNVDATVNFETGARLFLINNFFNKDLDAEIFKLFADVGSSSDWQDVDTFSHNSGRLIYSGNSPTLNTITEFGKTQESTLGELLNKSIKFFDFSIWADAPGYAILPHYDLAPFEHAVQIYMTDPTRQFEMMGTAFYTDKKRYLFEIPYRRNSGYFIDTTHNIMHGLHHSIPPGYYRYSIYLRYQSV